MHDAEDGECSQLPGLHFIKEAQFQAVSVFLRIFVSTPYGRRDYGLYSSVI
jgi:hypothetical protein